MQNGFLQLLSPDNSIVKFEHLLAFTGYWAIGGSYQFKLEAVVKENIDLQKVIGSELVWCLATESSITFKGLVKNLQIVQHFGEFKKIFITIDSALITLKQVKRSRIFRNKTFSQVIEEVACDYPILKYQNHLSLSHDLFREFWVQYNLSDFDFFLQTVNELNIYFYVDRNGYWVFKENQTAIPAKEIDFDSVSNLTEEITVKSRMISFLTSQNISLDERFIYKKLIFRVIKIEFQVQEYKIQTNTLLQSKFKFRIWATQGMNDFMFKKTPVCGFKMMNLTSEAYCHENKIKVEASFSDMDIKNNAILADLTQVWSSAKQGWQFIPAKASLALASALNGYWDKPLVTGILNNNYYENVLQIKTKLCAINFSENIQISSQKNLEKFIGGSVSEEVSGKSYQKIEKNFLINLRKGIYSLKAKKIVFKSAGSSLELSDSSSLLQAQRIEFQTPSGIGRGLARMGDVHICPMVNLDFSAHKGGAIKEGARQIKIDKASAARFRDSAECFESSDVIVQGIDDLLIAGQAAAYEGANCLHGGSVITGSKTVLSLASHSSSVKTVNNSSAIKNDYWVQLWQI